MLLLLLSLRPQLHRPLDGATYNSYYEAANMSVRMENVAAPRKMNYKMMVSTTMSSYVRVCWTFLFSLFPSVFISLSLRLSFSPDPLSRRRVRSARATRCLLRAAPSCARARANVACDKLRCRIFCFITHDICLSHTVRVGISRLPYLSADISHTFFSLEKAKLVFQQDCFLPECAVISGSSFPFPFLPRLGARV